MSARLIPNGRQSHASALRRLLPEKPSEGAGAGSGGKIDQPRQQPAVLTRIVDVVDGIGCDRQ